MYTTPIETHKAKKQHRCEWCWQLIEAGETYSRYRFYDDGEAGTVKMHPECFEAMQDEASDEGGWVEWTPGQERPAPSNIEHGRRSLRHNSNRTHTPPVDLLDALQDRPMTAGKALIEKSVKLPVLFIAKVTGAAPTDGERSDDL